MSRLEVRSELTHYVSGHDLEEFINEEYGVEGYEIVADMELGNQAFATTVTPRELSKFDQEQLDEFKAGKSEGWNLHVILQDLAYRGRILPGRYVIDTTW